MKKKICFLGLGNLGMPCAEKIAEKGHNVKGFDLIKKESKLIKVCDNLDEAIKDCEFIFIAAPTPHNKNYDGRKPILNLPPKDFNYKIVENILRKLNKIIKKNQIIVLISTVLPGTVRRQFIKLIKDKKFIYNPYLIAMGSVGWDMVNPEMVMIGSKNGEKTPEAKKLINFYKTIMQNKPRYINATWDECECIKIFYNTFISAKISLVNMIQDVAIKQGNINVDVVTNALANAKMRITGPQYMTAGMGDGGACHPRDNIALRYMAKKINLGYDIFHSIMRAREVQAENLADMLIYFSKKKKMKIFIHGKAYKPGVEYLDGSYSILIGNYIKKKGIEPIYIDPKTGDNVREADGVILLAHNSDISYKYAYKIQKKQSMYCKFKKGSIIIDPWRKFKKSKHYTVIHYGNTRFV